VIADPYVRWQTRRPLTDQVYVFRWNRAGRKGQRCWVMARGKMNSCMVRFEDGELMVTSRNALRKETVMANENCTNCKQPVYVSHSNPLKPDGELLHSSTGSHYCDNVKNRGPVAELEESQHGKQ